ncbi:MAG: hypothetical protein Q9182_005950 [Xanthomendoza sp. 2 TL-2023]
MPPAQKKRKTGAGVMAVKNTTILAPSKQRGIQIFGKISKSQPVRPRAGKDDAKLNTDSIAAVSVSHLRPVPPVNKKRQVQDTEEEDRESQATPRKRIKSQEISGGTSPDQRQKLANPPIAEPHLKTPRKKAPFKSITIETPTKGARSYLESLNLASSPSTEHNSSSPISPADTSAPSPPPHANQEPAPTLPEELQDLINLHSSFLTALSLHYAHHGSLTPADFRLLRPNIERSWRKRKVTIQDIQQIFGLYPASLSNLSTLFLSDYGHSKICIELSPPAESASQHKCPLNEESLNHIFITNLLDRWKAYASSHPPATPPTEFINSLPLAPITPCTSTSQLAPLLAKGQRRLEDLKSGAIKAHARSFPNKSTDKENIRPQPTDPKIKQQETQTRKSNLLDRIKVKQEAHLLSTANSTPLTREQIQRHRALRRLEEIVPVLNLLGSSGNAAMKSFTMPTIVQHLQMSLRNPIETEDAVRAVRLLADEVAPTWVGIREVGKLVGVTLRKGGMVGGREEMRRVVRELVDGA